MHIFYIHNMDNIYILIAYTHMAHITGNFQNLSPVHVHVCVCMSICKCGSTCGGQELALFETYFEDSWSSSFQNLSRLCPILPQEPRGGRHALQCWVLFGFSESAFRTSHLGQVPAAEPTPCLWVGPIVKGPLGFYRFYQLWPNHAFKFLSN